MTIDLGLAHLSETHVVPDAYRNCSSHSWSQTSWGHNDAIYSCKEAGDFAMPSGDMLRRLDGLEGILPSIQNCAFSLFCR